MTSKLESFLSSGNLRTALYVGTIACVLVGLFGSHSPLIYLGWTALLVADTLKLVTKDGHYAPWRDIGVLDKNFVVIWAVTAVCMFVSAFHEFPGSKVLFVAVLSTWVVRFFVAILRAFIGKQP